MYTLLILSTKVSQLQEKSKNQDLKNFELTPENDI